MKERFIVVRSGNSQPCLITELQLVSRMHWKFNSRHRLESFDQLHHNVSSKNVFEATFIVGKIFSFHDMWNNVNFVLQAFRQAARPAPSFASKLSNSRITPIAARFLSAETRQVIDKAVNSAPVVLFMKGTPETPQCGFSRASIQILGLQGVDPAKFSAFNVLEDDALRAGMYRNMRDV